MAIDWTYIIYAVLAYGLSEALSLIGLRFFSRGSYGLFAFAGLDGMASIVSVLLAILAFDSGWVGISIVLPTVWFAAYAARELTGYTPGSRYRDDAS